jgi:hypothetical protein
MIQWTSWRVVFWVLDGLSAICLLLIAFTLPETAYSRNITSSRQATAPVTVSSETTGAFVGHVDVSADPEKLGGSSEHVSRISPPSTGERNHGSRSFRLKRHCLVPKVYTRESIWLIMFRPVALLMLPGVFWATLINSVTVGMIVVLSSKLLYRIPEHLRLYGPGSWADVSRIGNRLSCRYSLCWPFLGLGRGQAYPKERWGAGARDAFACSLRQCHHWSAGWSFVRCWIRFETTLDVSGHWHWTQ